MDFSSLPFSIRFVNKDNSLTNSKLVTHGTTYKQCDISGDILSLSKEHNSTLKITEYIDTLFNNGEEKVLYLDCCFFAQFCHYWYSGAPSPWRFTPGRVYSVEKNACPSEEAKLNMCFYIRFKNNESYAKLDGLPYDSRGQWVVLSENHTGYMGLAPEGILFKTFEEWTDILYQDASDFIRLNPISSTLSIERLKKIITATTLEGLMLDGTFEDWVLYCNSYNGLFKFSTLSKPRITTNLQFHSQPECGSPKMYVSQIQPDCGSPKVSQIQPDCGSAKMYVSKIHHYSFHKDEPSINEYILVDSSVKSEKRFNRYRGNRMGRLPKNINRR